MYIEIFKSLFNKRLFFKIVKCCENNEKEESQLTQSSVPSMINNNEENHDEGECINKISDEYSLRVLKTHKSSKCDDQSSLSSFEDKSSQEEVTENQSERNTSEKSKNCWTEEDTVRLLFIVNNLGRKWKIIAENYKSQLKNKSGEFLANIYWSLKQNKIRFEKLEEKSKLVNDVEILENHKFNTTEKRLNWSADEITYLVHGFSKYGTDWELLLRDYKTHFCESRSGKDLKNKYSSLKRSPKKLLYFQQKASLLSNHDNTSVL